MRKFSLNKPFGGWFGPAVMTTAQVVEASVTVNNNSPIRDYVDPDDQTQPTFEMTSGSKPFTVFHRFLSRWEKRCY